MTDHDHMQRARELLATEWRKDGFHCIAMSLQQPDLVTAKNPAIRAIAAALRSKSAQAVPEGLSRDAARYRWLREHFRFCGDTLRKVWFDPSLEPNDGGVPTDLDQEIDRLLAAAPKPEGR